MANLTYVAPFFIVADIQTAIAFYMDKLGFETRFAGPEGAPFFAIVGRDQISIMLKEIAPEVKPMPNSIRHQWARWDAYVHAEDPDALFEEYRSRGVAFRRAIEDDEDGLRGFEIADADGYVLFFGRPTS